MKLHIVVMPQRGLFQGFGTQCPDWKKKALLWALDSPADPPPLPWQQGGAGGGAVARYIHNTTARSWDQTKRIGELDVYSTLQDWGRLLALESQVQVRAG